MSDEAKKVISDLFEELGLEFNSGNTYFLFDGDGELEFETESEYISWRDRDSKPVEYKAHQDEVQAMYDTVNSKLERIECEGGGEGEGEYCYGVIKIGDKYLKAEWSYYSYNGCDYDYIKDTIKFVTPTTKTITVYE